MVSRLDRRFLIPLVFAPIWLPSAASAAENDTQRVQLQQAEVHLRPGEPPAALPATRQDAAPRPAVTEDAVGETGADPDPARFDRAGIESWWRRYEERRKGD